MLRVSLKNKLLDFREKFLDFVGDKFKPLTFQLSNVGELETLMPLVHWLCIKNKSKGEFFFIQFSPELQSARS